MMVLCCFANYCFVLFNSIYYVAKVILPHTFFINAPISTYLGNYFTNQRNWHVRQYRFVPALVQMSEDLTYIKKIFWSLFSTEKYFWVFHIIIKSIPCDLRVRCWDIGITTETHITRYKRARILASFLAL